MPRFHFRAVTGSRRVRRGRARGAETRPRWSSSCASGATCRSPPSRSARAPARAAARACRTGCASRCSAAAACAAREVAIITRELATLLDAGLTVDQSLRLLVDLAESEADAPPDRRPAAAGPGRQHARRCARPARGGVLARLRQHGARGRGRRRARRGARHASRSYLDQAEALAEQVRSALVYPLVLLVDGRALDRGAADRGGAAVHAAVRERRAPSCRCSPGW